MLIFHKRKKKKLKTQIEINGGINYENAKMAIEAGVDLYLILI